jgi:His-Xaa-Ser repeat-associated downstream radical SAM protein
MLNLRARAAALSPIDIPGKLLAKVTCNPSVPAILRSRSAFLYEGQCQEIPDGFAVTLYRNGVVSAKVGGTNQIELSAEQYFLSEGDVVRIGPDLKVSVIYRKNASSNALLVTEQCNSFCIMCSQPPKAHDDSYLIDDWIEAIPYIDESCPELTITGGEPTLLKEKFFELINTIRAQLPTTAIHILTNGRNFKDIELARRLASIHHPDLMLGIPLYCDVASIHDFVVQADGAFDETIDGIINLKRYGQRIELRVVIHAENYERLPRLAEFIARNLQFIDQVSLMGLELTGFARANLDAVWIDPADYQNQLAQAVDILVLTGMTPIIFNHQLCLLRPELRKYAVKSISDWKREYMPECEGCIEVNRGCGGFFSSAKQRYSKFITPIRSVT